MNQAIDQNVNAVTYFAYSGAYYRTIYSGSGVYSRSSRTRLDLTPVYAIVTIGATVLSDTLSLIVFAVCVSTYATGFSPQGLAIQLIEIVVFVPLILIGLSRAGAWALSKMGSDEEAHFLLMLGVMAVAGAIADLNAAGQRMLDGTMLNAVLVLMLATSILGPVLTGHFARRMLDKKEMSGNSP